MKTKIYINGMGSISAQEINDLFEEKVIQYNENIIPALTPDFKKHIPPMQLRRMSKGIKMGLTAAKTALQDANVKVPDAVITGTGQGSKIDTEKFLQEMLDREEETLSPTSFIQSTHNTIGGQIALNLECKGYNMTYSQNSASFESALFDAKLYLNEDPENSVLVGSIDEISEKITSFQTLDGQVKSQEINNFQLLENKTPGTIISEGAHFFTISAEITANSYAELVDVSVVNSEDSTEVSVKIQQFLQKNNRSPADIDVVILGKNGDIRFDDFYDELQKKLFPEKPQLAFKHLSGDYDTATGFAVVLGCHIFRKKFIPSILNLNEKPCTQPREILIYNQYLGEDHSFILLRSIEL